MKKTISVILAFCLTFCVLSCTVLIPVAAESTKMIRVKGYCSRFAFRPKNVSLTPGGRYRVSFYYENVNDARIQFGEGADTYSRYLFWMKYIDENHKFRMLRSGEDGVVYENVTETRLVHGEKIEFEFVMPADARTYYNIIFFVGDYYMVGHEDLEFNIANLKIYSVNGDNTLNDMEIGDLCDNTTVLKDLDVSSVANDGNIHVPEKRSTSKYIKFNTITDGYFDPIRPQTNGGDLNKDGNIGIADLVRYKKIVSGVTASDLSVDFDGNGLYGPEDAARLTNILLNTGNNATSVGISVKDPTDCNSALCLAIQAKRNPGFYTDAILTYLRYLIAGGNEPTFDYIANFTNPMIAGTLAVAKTVPSVWGRLTQSEAEKLDYIMKCMAVHAAQATDDSCNYTTGPGGKGNYNKNWNPNYPIGNAAQIMFCVSYFGGGDAVNNILKSFDYDTYIARFTEWGWTNVLSVWTRETDLEAGTVTYRTAAESVSQAYDATGKIITDDGNGHMTLCVTTTSDDIAAGLTGYELGEERIINYTTPKAMLMEGGEVYCMRALYRINQYVGKPGGTGIGVPAIGAKGYSYKGNDLTPEGVRGIWNCLLDYCYSGGDATSKAVSDGNGGYLCYIENNLTTPVQGLDGMMKEFNSGQRSSVIYCQEDFIMCEATTAALAALGLYNPLDSSNLEMTKKVWVGNTDFLFKAENGYWSYTGSAARGKPEFSYGVGAGYNIWRFYWLDNGANRFFTKDFIH